MKEKDALDDLDFLNDLEGFSLNRVTKTLTKLMESCEHMAVALALFGQGIAEGTEDLKLAPRVLRDLANSVKMTSDTVVLYARLYQTFVTQARGSRAQNDGALHALIGVLDVEEISLLQGWLHRMEVAGAGV